MMALSISARYSRARIFPCTIFSSTHSSGWKEARSGELMILRGMRGRLPAVAESRDPAVHALERLAVAQGVVGVVDALFGCGEHRVFEKFRPPAAPAMREFSPGVEQEAQCQACGSNADHFRDRHRLEPLPGIPQHLSHGGVLGLMKLVPMCLRIPQAGAGVSFGQ